MFKSLQSQMIFVMFLLILCIILFTSFFSIIKVEQIYYNGFIDEMLATIASFGISSNESSNINSSNNRINVSEPNIQKMIDNFNIYFSLDKSNRKGTIVGQNDEIVFASAWAGLTSGDIDALKYDEENPVEYKFINDTNQNIYRFVYYIRDASKNKTLYMIIVDQSKTYINSQLKEMIFFYVGSVVVILLVTLAVGRLLAATVTKPIELIRKKAQLIAAGSDFEEMDLVDEKGYGYEVNRLYESFNLMITQIKNNMNEISNEKNKLEAILLHLSDGVLAFNVNGELTHMNLAAKKMLNIDKEKKFEEIFKKAQIDINMEKIMYLDDWTTTEQMVRIDDKIVNIFFATFRNEEDNLGGLVAVVHDITKQAKLDDMRKEFVANVSHELKTPLTSIKTYTETILDDEMDIHDEETQRFLNVILAETNRMTKLVSDLLQLTKFDYKKIAWNKVYFDLPELTKQICEKHKIQAETKNQTIECFVTSQVPMAYADRDGMEQVITNILTNAIKYTPEGGSIKAYVGCVHSEAYIKVIDTGIGIPEKDLPRVFERFYRVDKARSREMGGTGLGLPIAKEIIEANGGSIDIKSTVGKGTEVIIKVPVTAPKEVAKLPEGTENNSNENATKDLNSNESSNAKTNENLNEANDIKTNEEVKIENTLNSNEVNKIEITNDENSNEANKIEITNDENSSEKN